jgi:hypothetical protein
VLEGGGVKGVGLVGAWRLTRGVLYLSALTARDWRENCDRTRTDRDVHLREVAWYGKRLRRWFRPSGAGFWAGTCPRGRLRQATSSRRRWSI